MTSQDPVVINRDISVFLLDCDRNGRDVSALEDEMTQLESNAIGGDMAY